MLEQQEVHLLYQFFSGSTFVKLLKAAKLGFLYATRKFTTSLNTFITHFASFTISIGTAGTLVYNTSFCFLITLRTANLAELVNRCCLFSVGRSHRYQIPCALIIDINATAIVKCRPLCREAAIFCLISKKAVPSQFDLLSATGSCFPGSTTRIDYNPRLVYFEGRRDEIKQGLK